MSKITDKQVEDWFKSFAEIFSIEGEFELKAIHLNRQVVTSEGFTKRITEGMQVRIIDGDLQESGSFTHKILGCFGTITSDNLNIMVQNLNTLKLGRVKL